MLRIGIVVLAAQLTACSFVFVHAPPPGQPAKEIESKGKDKFECTSSRLVPWLDVAWSGLMALNFLLAASANEKDLPFSRAIALPLYGVLGAAGGAGIYIGFKRTGECRDAHAPAIKAGVREPEA